MGIGSLIIGYTRYRYRQFNNRLYAVSA